MTATITPKSFKYIVGKLEDFSTALRTDVTISSASKSGDNSDSFGGLKISLPINSGRTSGRIDVAFDDNEKGLVSYYDYDSKLVESFELDGEGTFTESFDTAFRAALLKYKHNN
jgi:hypothetical protein